MGGPFLRRAKRLTGLDYDESAIAFTTENFGQFYDDAVVGSMMELPFDSSCFDVVVCLEGIEHVTRQEGIVFLDEAFRVLRQSGVLLISCPLSIDSGHSGNEYHLYEWALDELRNEVERGFSIVKNTLFSGPAGKVVITAAQRRQFRRQEGIHITIRYDESIMQTANWIAGQWVDSKARFASCEDPELLSTCFGVLAQETVGTLERSSNQRPQEIAEYILRSQDEYSGLFAPTEIKSEDLLWPLVCDIRYVKYQVTYFALSALTALGKRPLHALRFAERFLDRDYALGWVEAGPWHDPWNHSNRIMFLLRYLLHIAIHEDRVEAYQVYDAVLGELLRQQNPETGLWHGSANSDIQTAVYAAYHFFPFIFWRGILPPYAERIIDSTLSIQHADGLFAPQIGGGACEDLDAIDMLVKFSLVTDHRAKEVKRALFRAFDRILQLQKSDGGFPNYLLQPLPPHDGKSFKRRIGEMIGLDVILGRPYKRVEMSYYSGWKRIKATRGDADMWAAWFRPLSLNLIVSRYPELGSLPEGARFHKLPGLGWHDVACIKSAKPASGL